MKTVTFRIWRGDANGGKFVDYTTEITEGLVVLDVVHKILNGYIRFLRSRKSNEPYVLRDEKQTDGILDDELNDGFNASTF